METKNIIIETFKANRAELSALILKSYTAHNMPRIDAKGFLAHCMNELVSEANCAEFDACMKMAHYNEIGAVYGILSDLAPAESMKFYSFGHCIEHQQNQDRARRNEFARIDNL